MVPEADDPWAWPPSLVSSRTLSTYTFMAAALVDVNVVGPGVVMAIMPVQRGEKFAVGTRGRKELLLTGLLLPKLKVPARPGAAATEAVWNVGVPAMAAVPPRSRDDSVLVPLVMYLLARPLAAVEAVGSMIRVP